jgi:transposase
MVEGTMGSHQRKGSTKMSKRNIACAGIDTGKRRLDVAIHGRQEELAVDNTADGHAALSAFLRQYGVKRVGIEASGGYEREVVLALRRDGFTVVVFQPARKYLPPRRGLRSPTRRKRCAPSQNLTRNAPRTTRSMRG